MTRNVTVAATLLACSWDLQASIRNDKNGDASVLRAGDCQPFISQQEVAA